MKKTFRSAAVGFLCVLFIDSLSRVIFTIYLSTDFSPFSYIVYPGSWPYAVMGIALLAAFFGGMMVITLSRRKWPPFLLYLLLLGSWRVAPLILTPTEPGWIIITSTVLSLAVAFSARQFIVDQKVEEPPF